MQDYTKDLVVEIGKDVLSQNTEKAIQAAINNALKNGVQGKDMDFESLFNTVMKSCVRTIIIDLCDKTLLMDEGDENRLVGSLYQFITGGDCLESADYVTQTFMVIGGESMKELFKRYDYELKILDVANALDDVKTTDDFAYYNAVEKLADSFISLANLMAGSVPVIGDMIKNMISVASGSFEYQYNYILNDFRKNNTAMAELALYDDLESAALYLLAQENLIFDEEAIVTMLLDKRGVKVNSPVLAFLAFTSADHETFIHRCAEVFGFLKEGSDYIDSDLVRKYCVDILINRGYAIKGMTYEEIQKELSILEGNIKKNEDNNKHSNPNNYFWNEYSFIYDTAFRVNEIKADTSTARYDPLVIDMGRTGLKFYNYTSFCK